MTMDNSQSTRTTGAAKSSPGIVSRIRTYFLTGLIVAGPVAITLWLVWWFVTWVDGLVRPFIPGAYRPETYLPVQIPGLGLIIAFVALTLLGFFTANLVGRKLVDFGESILSRMPVVRPIYRTAKQIFQTLFSKSESSFRRVALIETPRLMAEALALEPQIEHFARDLAKSRNVLYLGRGTSFPLALEGALKLKEISYIHAEGYAAGELKHGPIALVDENMPVIVIAPHDKVFEKTFSNMQEVAARGGRLILMTDAEGARAAKAHTTVTLTLPTVHPAVAPIVYAVPVQLLAYHTAVLMGTDVDQPRNLAKSVTVE